MMMGLPNWLHWTAWFIKYMIFLCISCIFMAIFYAIKVGDMFDKMRRMLLHFFKLRVLKVLHFTIFSFHYRLPCTCVNIL